MVFNTDPVASQNQSMVYSFKVVALASSLSLRLLGILGLIELVRRKEYGLLLLLVSLAAYVAAAHLTVGRPRFRVPIEAPLALLALYGVAWLREYFPLRSLRPST